MPIKTLDCRGETSLTSKAMVPTNREEVRQELRFVGARLRRSCKVVIRYDKGPLVPDGAWVRLDLSDVDAADMTWSWQSATWF